MATHVHVLSENISWAKNFDPEKRLFTGQAYHDVKRLLDLLLVGLTIPIWLPLIVIIALIIKISSPNAPVIFTQNRTGRGGRRFKMYKFRSMFLNAEALKVNYVHLNELQWPDFRITNDPRVTRIGRILRKTNLDELPQLFNILRGEMTLVGPRPTSFGAESYQLWHTERLDVIPGLTGLWQFADRTQLQFDDRLRLDIAYIEHRSLSLDILIIIKTISMVIKLQGAN